MRTILIASLRIYARRYIAAGIAVIVSVAFIVTVGTLIAGARAGLMATDGAPYRGADYVVYPEPAGPRRGPPCCSDTLDISAAVNLIGRLGDNAAGHGRVLLPSGLARSIQPSANDTSDETTVGPIATVSELRWQTLVSGRFPTRVGEAVMHVWDATARNVAIGDRIHVGEGIAETDLTIVGIVESPSTWRQASLYVTWPQYLMWSDQPTFHIGDISIRGQVGPLPEGMTAQPAEKYVTDKLTGLNKGTDVFALMLFLFASVAVLVSALVIANTFSILLTQRLRDFALLRCVGTTRRQIEKSVRQEATAVGVLASLVGLSIGVGFGYGAIVLVNAFSPRAPIRAPDLPLLWILGAFLVGVVVTVAASWLPTRNVVKVSPLVALRPDHATNIHTSRGRLTLALALLLSAGGLALLWLAITHGNRVSMLAGGMLVFAGILLASPAFIPALALGIGAFLDPAGRLAAQNAARNPQRTATTVAALLIGITLITAVLTGIATYRAAMDEHRNTRLPIDVALSSTGRPISDSLLDQVRRTQGVEQAVLVNGVVAQITGWDARIPIVAAPATEGVARDGDAFAQVTTGTINLDYDAFRTPNTGLRVRPGDWVTVRVGDHQVRLQAVLLGGWGKAAIVTAETLAQLVDVPEPRVVWVRASATANPVDLVRDLQKLAEATDIVIEDHLQARMVGNRQLDILTWSVLGLLGLSVVIALVGITNTLALSVVERAREHALLRALGLTRRQLRSVLAIEAILISAIAGALGTAIGVGFAWVTYRTVIKPILIEATMQVPWLLLGAVVLVGTLAGLLASLLPARRAARVSPTTGLALD
ncbi:ABC transporter permease [Pseudomonas aeruginosa]|uniref:ABC transporter permease n=1 Tax=Pseudomonas aeruginosa TaxID=287 RepID=UPI00259D09EB|nr:FtsX-like permease family protein [Pseudomonas aeruginosa]MDM4790295.1 FtsX-like permease family protein [Pseudomonas aeruginosa]MDM4792630.1 FtsX-like permease family protein [Pseudomonas aeruginosa]MDM4835740.1 FtsX-like permease family protein [Pseudomonas aeruginosa]MDM4851421.1 FtsX-like permease family protein [Pseudomonas aeruginosa]MDM5014647.1 FtsX-like permease family protein [Pseudomonas aeruginosa]